MLTIKVTCINERCAKEFDINMPNNAITFASPVTCPQCKLDMTVNAHSTFKWVIQKGNYLAVGCSNTRYTAA